MKISRTKSLLALALLVGLLLAWLPLKADAPKKKPKRLTGLEVAELLENKRFDFAGFDDPKTTLQEALDKLQERHGINISINEAAFKFDQVQDVGKTDVAQSNPIPAKSDVTLAEVLRMVLSRVPAPTGATFLIRDNEVEVTTGRCVSAEVNRVQVGAGEGPEDIFFVFPNFPLIYTSFDNFTLAPALKYLNDHSNYSVILDPRASEKGKSPVTGTVKNLPLDATVRLLAEMADLRVVQLDNVLFVTTPEKAIRLEREHAQRQEEKAARFKSKPTDPQP